MAPKKDTKGKAAKPAKKEKPAKGAWGVAHSVSMSSGRQQGAQVHPQQQRGGVIIWAGVAWAPPHQRAPPPGLAPPSRLPMAAAGLSTSLPAAHRLHPRDGDDRRCPAG